MRQSSPRNAAVMATCAAALLAGYSQASAQEIVLEGIIIEAPSPVGSIDVSEAASQYGTLIVAEDAFVPVTVVTDRDVLATSGGTITDAIDERPGIIGSTFAPGSSRPIIRGLDNTRVRVQENGIGSHDVSTLSEDHAVPIDPFAAEKIEVIRGPATLRYGSGAIGGVVAVENGRIPSAVPRGGFKGKLTGGLTSVDDGKEGAFSATAGTHGFAVHVDGFRRDAGDYDTPEGAEFNSFVEADGLAGGFSLIGPDGYVGVSLSRYSSFYGIPGEEAGEERPRIDLEQDRLQAKGEWRVRDYGIEALRFWFGASDYEHAEVVDEGGTDEIGQLFQNDEIEGRVELQHLPVALSFGELTGAIGVQFGDKETSGIALEDDADSLLEPADTRSFAAFIFEELKISPATAFQAAARIENTQVDGQNRTDPLDNTLPLTAFERDFTPVSGSVGVRHDLGYGVVASFTGQYAERAPEAQELFSKGIHEATGTFEIGDPDLGIESARTVEFGLKRAEGPFRFDATAYYTEFDGFIFKQLTGEACGDNLASCGDEDELDQVLFTQRDATFYGAEIAAQYEVAPIWNGVWGINGQYDFVKAEFDDGDNVPRIPPHRLGGGLFYRDANWFAQVGVLHAFEQDEVNRESDEQETPGYTLVSAEISYTEKLPEGSDLGTEITLGLKGENLADEDVLNHTSFKRREDVLEPGINVKAFATIKLN